MIKKILAAIIVIVVVIYVDWSNVLSIFSPNYGEAPLLELTTLRCEVTQGEAHTSSLDRPQHVEVFGKVKNISEMTLNVKANIVYRSDGQVLDISGEHTTSVKPYPLEPGTTGSFSYVQYGVPYGTTCNMKFTDTWGGIIPYQGIRSSY
jgi:hypothetical protein